MRAKQEQLTAAAAARILGVAAEAGASEVRAAYLRQVRLHPPDRDAEQFERVRDAYELLRDPRARAGLLLHADPRLPLDALAEGELTQRRFVGPAAWLRVVGAKR